MDSPAGLSEGIAKTMRDITNAMTRKDVLSPIFKGKHFAPMHSVESIEYALNRWRMPENSVVVASFPKTGTMWCLEVVRQILCGDDDDLLNKSRSVPVLAHFLEMGSAAKYTDLYPHLPKKFFFTHIPADIFNFEMVERSNSKIIYIYRNPKDQIVSWYNFFNKQLEFVSEQGHRAIGQNWSDFFANYTAGSHPLGTAPGEWYPDHLTGWMNRARRNKNILVVEYESLKKDFPNELRRMAAFLQVELGDGIVDKITTNCSISQMKRDEKADQTNFLQKNVNKGEVGGWKDHLTVSQSELVDRIFEEKLSGTGIKFTYTI